MFKNALMILVAFGIGGLSSGDVNLLVNLAAGLFILPFFLLSATAGQLADKLEMSRLIRAIKLLEIGIMLLGAVALSLRSVPFLLAVLCLMGVQSALFGPVKYAILPQHLRAGELIGGNALVEAATFLAILLGTLLGGWLIAQGQGTVWVGTIVVAVALLGYGASRSIPPTRPTDPGLRINWNPITETVRNIGFMRRQPVVFLSVLGISWFWFYGATFLAQLPNYTKLVLGGDETVVTLLLTVFSFGVGGGSLLCERLSGRQVEIGLVPLGSIGLTLFGIDLYFTRSGEAGVASLNAAAFLAQAGGWRVAVDLLMLGVFGGLYIVPLYALIQTRCEPSHRSRVIAGNNILNALFMVVSALLSIALLAAGLSIPQLLLTVALMNAAVAVFIYSRVPEFLMRFLVWMLIRSLYRIRVTGLEHIPAEGPALVSCNHVSFVDALIVGGSIRRPVRFVMYHKIFRIPVLSFIFRTARAIPIAPAKEDEALMRRAFDQIAEALDAGEVVGIFPEGMLTPDGRMQPFRSGVERIIARTPVPVVPMAVRGLWRSMWSKRSSRLGRARLPRRFRARIELQAAAPIPPQQLSTESLEARIRELRGSYA